MFIIGLIPISTRMREIKFIIGLIPISTRGLLTFVHHETKFFKVYFSIAIKVVLFDVVLKVLFLWLFPLNVTFLEVACS